MLDQAGAKDAPPDFVVIFYDPDQDQAAPHVIPDHVKTVFYLPKKDKEEGYEY